MALKIAINGFGRIGRALMRIAATRNDIEVVAINDLADEAMMLHLLKYDSVHGSFDANFEGVTLFQESDPKNLDFAAAGAEIVIECTGLFLTQELVKTHIEKGVKRVILSAPTQDNVTPTFVMGVNHEAYNAEAIISNASCTTNCLAPIAKILDEAYGIEKGLMTTIHSYTNDQNLLDVKHNRDIRRSRAAAINMIPTTTGAARALSRVLPQLEGKLDGTSIRVPTPDVSMVDLTLHLTNKTNQDEVIALLNAKAQTEYKGLLLIDKDKRVSQDFVGSAFSAIVAEDLIQVMGEDMLGIRAWYDNEWGYSNRLLDMAIHISK